MGTYFCIYLIADLSYRRHFISSHPPLMNHTQIIKAYCRFSIQNFQFSLFFSLQTRVIIPFLPACPSYNQQNTHLYDIRLSLELHHFIIFFMPQPLSLFQTSIFLQFSASATISHILTHTDSHSSKRKSASRVSSLFAKV